VKPLLKEFSTELLSSKLSSEEWKLAVFVVRHLGVWVCHSDQLASNFFFWVSRFIGRLLTFRTDGCRDVSHESFSGRFSLLLFSNYRWNRPLRQLILFSLLVSSVFSIKRWKPNWDEGRDLCARSGCRCCLTVVSVLLNTLSIGLIMMDLLLLTPWLPDVSWFRLDLIITIF
jgi:hypothetical protein